MRPVPILESREIACNHLHPGGNTMRIAVGAMAIAAVMLGVAAPAASADPITHHQVTASRTVTDSSSPLTCHYSFNGPDASMTCVGTGTWQMDIYCNFPSPSPIQNGWITQVNTTRTSAGSCWFHANVQMVTLELKSSGSVPTKLHLAPALQRAAASGLSCNPVHSGPNATMTCSGTGTWQMDIYCDWPSPSPIRNGWITQVNTTRTSSGSCWFDRNVQYVTLELGP